MAVLPFLRELPLNATTFIGVSFLLRDDGTTRAMVRRA
jgi:hypothetical protein